MHSSKDIELGTFCSEKKPDQHIENGNAFYSNKKYDEAIKEYTITINNNREEAEQAYFMRGRAYALLNNCTQAAMDFSAAIDISPENPYYFYHRGVTYYNRANAFDLINLCYPLVVLDRKSAIEDFNRVILLDADFKNAAYAMLGKTYDAHKYIIDAAIGYSKALELNPHDIEIHKRLKSFSRQAIFSDIDRLSRDKQIIALQYCLHDNPLKKRMLQSESIFHSFWKQSPANSKEYLTKMILKLKKIDPDFNDYADHLNADNAFPVEMRPLVSYRMK